MGCSSFRIFFSLSFLFVAEDVQALQGGYFMVTEDIQDIQAAHIPLGHSWGDETYRRVILQLREDIYYWFSLASRPAGQGRAKKVICVSVTVCQVCSRDAIYRSVYSLLTD